MTLGAGVVVDDDDEDGQAPEQVQAGQMARFGGVQRSRLSAGGVRPMLARCVRAASDTPLNPFGTRRARRAGHEFAQVFRPAAPQGPTAQASGPRRRMRSIGMRR
ncbi:hypothetical protein D7Y27_25235 [Corallococcus sp. AB004]|nr:hypothetical protein D7Y04_07995 [Corallococcus sp. AB038B]RKI37589.1 hypothetical protein D7Y27_25235 [Corallococcus sp. AB004]